jgi:prevent-host-death family protein
MRSTRTINSADAKNKFAQLLDDVYANQTRYIIQRFGMARGVLISLEDFRRLLTSEGFEPNLLKEEKSEYRLGQDQSDTDVINLLNQGHL